MPRHALPAGWLRSNNAAVKSIEKKVRTVARLPVSVLISGETDTGKQALAWLIHQLSPRAANPLIRMRCLLVPDMVPEMNPYGPVSEPHMMPDLLRSASNGSLFLDGLASLSSLGQHRLFQYLSSGSKVRLADSNKLLSMNLRLISSEYRNLKELCAVNEFLPALYYRLAVVHLHLPPLRDRREDIKNLANFQIASICKRLECRPRTLSREAAARLSRHSWPGNLGELASTLERAIVLSGTKTKLEADSIDFDFFDQPAASPPHGDGIPAVTAIAGQTGIRKTHVGGLATVNKDEMDTGLTLEDYFQQFVLTHQETMSETELAQKLGISRKCLWERRQRFNLPRQNAQQIQRKKS